MRLDLGDGKVSLFEDLLSRKTKLSVIGLGYVGLPLAIAFSKNFSVIGFDLNKEKISRYKYDENLNFDSEIKFSDNPEALKEANFHMVTVPTPIYSNNAPPLEFIHLASEFIGKCLKKGSVVVYESTVYPGVTEEICIPILENFSGLKCGTDFNVGYSPERINSGDAEHCLSKITKIISATNFETLELLEKIYSLVVDAGIYRAENIKVAEAAKLIENVQRDVNIALMNEVTKIFRKMDLNTDSILKAAATKWNFCKFFPGLVGGHCIGVDSYYFLHVAEKFGCQSRLVTLSRDINENISKYIVENTIKCLIKSRKSLQNIKIAVLGFSFKENINDIRNTKVFNIIQELRDYGIEPLICDPLINADAAKFLYDIKITDINEISGIDALIVATAHDVFRRLSKSDIDCMFSQNPKILIDVKGIFNRNEFEKSGYVYWSL